MSRRYSMRYIKRFAWSHAKIRFVFDEIQSSRFLGSIVGRAKWLGLGLPSTIIASVVPAPNISTVSLLVLLPLASNKFYICRNLVFKRDVRQRMSRGINISKEIKGGGRERVIRDINVQIDNSPNNDYVALHVKQQSDIWKLPNSVARWRYIYEVGKRDLEAKKNLIIEN